MRNSLTPRWGCQPCLKFWFRPLLFGLLSAVVGAMCHSAFAQEDFGDEAAAVAYEAPPCVVRHLEEAIYPEELSVQLEPSQLEQGMRALEAWNGRYLDRMKYLRPQILSAYRNRRIAANYSLYKSAIFEKLSIYETFNITQCLDLPAPSSSKESRRAGVEAAFRAFEDEIREPPGSACPRSDMYAACLCKLLQRESRSDAEYGALAARCEQIPLREYVILPRFQRDCSLVRVGGDLNPTQGCLCEEVSATLYEDLMGNCQRYEYLPSRDSADGGCIADTVPNHNPIDVLDQTLCVGLEGIPAEDQCAETRRYLSPAGYRNLSAPLRGILSSGLNDLDKRLGVKKGRCSSPSYPSSPSEGKGNRPPSPELDNGDDLPLERFLALTPFERNILEVIARNYERPEVIGEGWRLDEHPKVSSLDNAQRLSQARRIAGIAELRNAFESVDTAILSSQLDLMHAMAEKRLALIAMKELAVKAAIFEDKRLAAIYWKTGASLTFTALALFPVTTPVAYGLIAAGVMVPNAIGAMVGPDDDPKVIKAAAKSQVKEACKAVAKGSKFTGASLRVLGSIETSPLVQKAVEGAEGGVGLAVAKAARAILLPKGDGPVRAGQWLNDQRVVRQTLRVLGGAVDVAPAKRRFFGMIGDYADKVGDVKNVGRIGGRVLGHGVSIAFTWRDLNAEYQRDVMTENPFWALINQQEQGIRALNERIALHKQNLKDLKAIRSVLIKKLKDAHCSPPMSSAEMLSRYFSVIPGLLPPDLLSRVIPDSEICAARGADTSPPPLNADPLQSGKNSFVAE